MKEGCPYTRSHGTHKNVASSISTNWVASKDKENALITSLRRIHTASHQAKSVEWLGQASWCLSTWPGDLSCSQFRRFFQRTANVFIFFNRDFCYSVPIIIAGSLNLILRWVNSQKCLMKIQYWDCDRVVMKIADNVFDFFWRYFHHPSRDLWWLQWVRCDGEEGGGSVWVTKITMEKIEQFLSPNSPIHSFENLKFSKLFDEDAILQILWSCDCDG